ncbi:hypothetical protein vseg_016706 [Gypsophila vaccaria]
MKSVPVGRRTRLQQAIIDKELREEKKRRWFAARSNWRNRLRGNVKLEVVNDENDEEEAIKVASDAYDKEAAVPKSEFMEHNVLVQRNQNLTGHVKLEVVNDDHGNDEEHKVGHVYYEVGKDVPMDGRNDEDSDDSVQIIGERWNPDDGYESHSSVTSSDSDGEQKVAVGDSYMGKDGKEAKEKDCSQIGVCSGVKVDGGNANDNRLKIRDEHNGKKREKVSNARVFRLFEGLVLPREPEMSASQNSSVSRRTRSHLKLKLRSKNRGDGTFSCPLAIDDESSSSSDGDKDDGHETRNNHVLEDTNNPREIGSIRKRCRPRRTTYVENKSEPKNDSDPEPEISSNKLENDTGGENVGKRKRGRPHKSTYVENISAPKSDSDSDFEPETDTTLESDMGGEDVGKRIKCRSLRTIYAENKSEPKNNFEPERETDTKLESDKGGENVGKRIRGGPLRSTCVEDKYEPKDDFDHESEITDTKLESEKGGEHVGKRKRGRPPKNRNAEVDSSPEKKRRRRLNTNEFENIMLDTFLENESAGLETLVSSVSEACLPLKFNFRVQNLLPEKSEEEEELEGLFNHLDFALRVCDVGCSISGSDADEDDDDVNCYVSVAVQANLCRQGKHYLILDDEVGIRCKFCPFVKLEIRYVTPDFDDNPFRKSENKSNHWITYNESLAGVSDVFHLPGFSHNPEHAHSDDIRGTVWDLIPGTKKNLYPHQQEAFEFIWRNVGGSVKLDELGNLTHFRIGGCIICHAPGTGKTRLAITFLQSFIRKYPISKPVIIAPRSMLLTWEDEIARWNVDLPFHNMNKTELSGREDAEVLKYADTVNNVNRRIQMAKLCSWAKGNGILGISYRLFEKLAGEKKGMSSIKRALLGSPGIMVLDEGHTLRNNESNIWNVLTKVETKRRIILSGTPFQNNFEELRNTLSLVREEFKNPLLLLGSSDTLGKGPASGYLDDNRRIVELRKLMKPFVHVHKGEILKKTLCGLFHSVLFLHPSDLQKTCCQKLSGVKYILELNHLVSMTCVHPSVLATCNHIPEIIDKVLLKKYKGDLEVGLKIKFLFELISLAVGEKILVFNRYLPPLNFIADLLRSRYHWREGKEFLYMKGKQDVKQRQSFISMFNDPSSEVRVLLASTKACGEGIHLVGASRVVLLDVVRNPSLERQAISRAYRIGQKKDVFVYHLIISGTLEEEKYNRLVNKDRHSVLVFSSEGEANQKRMVSSVFSEDRVLEEMIQNEKTNGMFSKIICESKADELINSFNPVNG